MAGHFKSQIDVGTELALRGDGHRRIDINEKGELNELDIGGGRPLAVSGLTLGDMTTGISFGTQINYKVWDRENGGPDRIRTCGLPLRRRSLYPAELRGHANLVFHDVSVYSRRGRVHNEWDEMGVVSPTGFEPVAN